MNIKLIKKSFPLFRDERYKPCRLICFHHAGGSAAVFRKWMKADPMVEILPIEVEGSGIRSDEVREQDFSYSTDSAAECIADIYDGRDTYVYGHSLGSVLAFDTVYKLRDRYGISIKKLFVAGRHAPFAEDPSEYRCYMGIEALKKELLELGGTPREILEDEGFSKYMLPNIFADYKLHESYEYRGECLDIPIMALSGKDDSDADENIMSEWEKCTTGSFSIHSFEGGHFFPYNESEEEVLSVIFGEIHSDIELRQYRTIFVRYCHKGMKKCRNI